VISQSSNKPELDAEALSNIEKEAHLLVKDFLILNKKLAESLNTISAASVCSLQTYQEIINRHCESVEENLKEEKIFLIKAKEISRAMEPIYKLQEKINSIKTVITTLENQI
jgi:hypothetical protein